MKTQVITLSKTKTIIQCCVISALIAVVISLVSSVNIHEFMQNILEWDSI